MSLSESITFRNDLMDSRRRSSYSSIPLLPFRGRPLTGGLIVNLRRHFWKNAIVFSVAIGLFAAGLQTALAHLMEELQSSTLLTAGFTFDAVGLVAAIVAQPLVYRFGCKHAALIATGVAFAPLALALYPSNWTTVPGAALAGLVVGVLYVAHWVYLSRLSALCSDALRIVRHSVQFRVFALTVAVHQCGVFLGHLVAFIVLSISRGVDQNVLPKHYVRFTLVGAAALLVAAAFIAIAIALDPLSRFTVDMDERGRRWGAPSPPYQENLSAWLLLLGNPSLLMLMPTALMLTGFDFFWTVDFAKKFGSDFDWTALVMAVCATLGVIPAVLFAWFNDNPGRTFPIHFASSVQLGILMTLGYWKTPPYSVVLAGLYTFLWFFASCARNAVFLALLVILFPVQPEDALATMFACSFVGRLLLFAFSTWLPLAIEVEILMCMLGLSALGFKGIEVYELVINKRILRRSGGPSNASGNDAVDPSDEF